MSRPLLLDLKEKSILKTLYENPGDFTGEVILNESTKNFDYIEVTLGTNDNEKIRKIEDPNGKIFWEELGYSLSNEYAKVFSKFAINNNNITPVVANCGYYTISYLNNSVAMHLDQTNYIRILKVVGGNYYEEKK